LFASALCWVLFDLLRKKLAATESPLALVTAFNVGAVPLYLLGYIFFEDVPIEQAYFVPGLIAAGLAVLSALGFVSALKHGDISKVIPVLALTPIISTVAAAVFLGEVLTMAQWIAMITVVIAIVGAQGGIGNIKNQVFVIMVLVSFGWGLGIVADKMALQHAGPFFHGVMQTSLASMILVQAFTRGYPTGRISLSFSRAAWWILPALLAFFVAVLAQWLALADLDAGVIETVKRSVGIVGAVIAGMLVFKERVSRAQIFWCLVILSGIPVILQPEI